MVILLGTPTRNSFGSWDSTRKHTTNQISNKRNKEREHTRFSWLTLASLIHAASCQFFITSPQKLQRRSQENTLSWIKKTHTKTLVIFVSLNFSLQFCVGFLWERLYILIYSPKVTTKSHVTRNILKSQRYKTPNP